MTLSCDEILDMSSLYMYVYAYHPVWMSLLRTLSHDRLGLACFAGMCGWRCVSHFAGENGREAELPCAGSVVRHSIQNYFRGLLLSRRHPSYSNGELQLAWSCRIEWSWRTEWEETTRERRLNGKLENNKGLLKGRCTTAMTDWKRRRRRRRKRTV